MIDERTEAIKREFYYDPLEGDMNRDDGEYLLARIFHFETVIKNMSKELLGR